MGRKHKKKLSERDIELIAEKEKERIRKRVLEAFCQRTKSPSGSSGIVAREDPRLLRKSLPNVRAREEDSSSSSMSDTDRQHSRRHKKTSSKHSSKTKDRGKKDVSRHIKMANDSRYQGLHAMSRGRITSKDICRITSTRLTKRIGLFNQGKKSSTVVREITIPDNVRKKTEEDLKRIIELSDDENKPPCLSLNYSPNPKQWIDSKRKEKAPDTGESNLQDIGYKSGGSVFSVTPATPKRKLLPPSTSSSSCHSYRSEDSDFPQEPPYIELADTFSHELKKLKEVFPQRDLLQETVDHLRKLMRQNAPRSATPTPKLLSSAKRSLQLDKVNHQDSYKQEDSCKENIVQAQGIVQNHNGISNSSQLNTKTFYENTAVVKNMDTNLMQGRYSKVMDVENGPSQHYKAIDVENKPPQHYNALVTDNRSNQCHKSYDYIPTTDFCSRAVSEAREYFHNSLFNSISTVHEIKHSIPETTLVKDATLLLQFNDEVAEKAKVTEELSKLLKQTSWNDEGGSSFGSVMHIDSQKSINSSQSSGYHGSQIISMLQNNMLSSNNQRPVTGFHQYPNIPNDFHVQNQFKLSSVLGADVLDEAESMDILDYLDTGTKHHLSRGRESPHHESENKLNPWSVKDLPPLQKPSLDTPSPPDDLFRKFYR